MPAVMCMAETSTMPSFTPLLRTISSTCGVRCTYARRVLVWNFRYSVSTFIPARGLSHGFFDFRNPAWTLQHFAWFRTVGGANNSVLLHKINQVRGTPVADAQPPLQQGSGGLPELHHQSHRVVIKRITVGLALGSPFSASRGNCRVPFFFRHFQELLLIFRRALGFPKFHHCGNFLFGDKRRMQTMHARR